MRRVATSEKPLYVTLKNLQLQFLLQQRAVVRMRARRAVVRLVVDL